MALSVKSEALKHVPWFSLSEWHRVYNQIYSNDSAKQTRAYETLLVWKARMAKLPVGVECTLSTLQVCLRDREWTPRIDEGRLPVYYENDLRLMYSTTIMRFLNQISNVGHTKQTSMFQIAKRLKIPEWIVGLRHDAAHGHELPPIGALRTAANLLLTWLHEEYWAAEATAARERLERSDEMAENENCESRPFVGFFELWTAVGLYATAGYETVNDLPDGELRNTLLNLCAVLPDDPLEEQEISRISENARNENNYSLSKARSILFSEMTTLSGRKKSIPDIHEIVVKTLLECEAFLPGPEIIAIFATDGEKFMGAKRNKLPEGMIRFWQDLLLLICDEKLLDQLIWQLLQLVNSCNEDPDKRFVASLWIKSILEALLKQRIVAKVALSIQHSLDEEGKKMTEKQTMQRVRDIVDKTNPELSDAPWLRLSFNVPDFPRDINFATDILLDANSLTKNFARPLLDLVDPPISQKYKDNLLKLVKIHTSLASLGERMAHQGEDDRVYDVQDLMQLFRIDDDSVARDGVADETPRNHHWENASGNHDWKSCPFGILPWQIDSLETLEQSTILQPRAILATEESTVVPGFLDEGLLTAQSRVNWDSVLRKKMRFRKKRRNAESDVVIDRAIEIVKKRHK